MREGVTDFGSGRKPFCRLQRMQIYAGDFPYFLAISVIAGKVRTCPVPNHITADFSSAELS